MTTKRLPTPARIPTLLAALALALAACGGRGVAPAPESPVPDTPPTTTPPAEPPAEPPAPPPAPWSAPPLAPGSVPPVLLEQWRRAENRTSCAPLAPARIAAPAAEPRAATFGGGWGVAWDTPGTRSAFGVAGTGVEPSPDTYDDWPYQVRWADGSRAGYGPEGGDGPNQLAYLRVAGQRCLYNVWSRLGVAHLEELLSALRFVDIR